MQTFSFRPLIANRESPAAYTASNEASMDGHLAAAEFPGAWKIFAVTVPTWRASKRASACRKAAENGRPAGNAGACIDYCAREPISLARNVR